jgi:hypothetical protein
MRLNMKLGFRARIRPTFEVYYKAELSQLQKSLEII